MTDSPSGAAGGAPALRSKWLVLLAACLGNLVLTIDGGIMGISYPALADAFDTGTSTILWVTVAFWVTGIGLVLTVGWLGDVGGRRFSYTLGFVLQAAALGVSAITVELWQLIASRICMGVGSAMVLAGVNAIIVDRFGPEDRAKAIGIAGAAVGIGLSTGPLVGGWLLDVLGWRALFYTRVPLALVTAGLSWWVLESPGRRTMRDFTVDKVGAVSLFTVLASLLLVINRSAEDGLLSPVVLAMAGLFVVATPVLIVSQRRSVRPILDFGLFRNPGYSFGLGVLLCHYTSLSAILLLAPFFFIDALGFSATKMGLFIMLHTLMRVFVAPISGALTPPHRRLDPVRRGTGGDGRVAGLAQPPGRLRVRGGDSGSAAAGGRCVGAVRAAEHHHYHGVGASGPVRDCLGIYRVGATAVVLGWRCGGGRHLRRTREGVSRCIRGCGPCGGLGFLGHASVRGRACRLGGAGEHRRHLRDSTPRVTAVGLLSRPCHQAPLEKAPRPPQVAG